MTHIPFICEMTHERGGHKAGSLVICRTSDRKIYPYEVWSNKDNRWWGESYLGLKRNYKPIDSLPKNSDKDFCMPGGIGI